MTTLIKYSPIRSDDKINYSFEDNVLTVEYTTKKNEEEITITDTFDFSGLSDGVANIDDIETSLPFNPFISIRKSNNVLKLEVIYFIQSNSSEAERFPEWREL